MWVGFKLYIFAASFLSRSKTFLSMKLFGRLIVVLFCLPVFFSACYSSKSVTYFQDLTDTSKIYSQLIKENYEAHIQPDDVIEIIVSSINPSATAIFNIGNNTPAITGVNSIETMPGTTNIRSAAPSGYLVNKDGIIDFPVLGKLKVTGLTMSQLKDSLAYKLEKFLKDPIVNVRLLNYKITVLGEVARPASYSLQSERVSVVDAIGMAGDLTIFGKRENILLVREENGQRNFIRLNLNSSKIFESPYYYLKQNDVLYIEPNKSKVASTDTQTVRNFALITSVITLLIVALTR
jgi:polysaccharide export outer membrane protein